MSPILANIPLRRGYGRRPGPRMIALSIASTPIVAPTARATASRGAPFRESGPGRSSTLVAAGSAGKAVRLALDTVAWGCSRALGGEPGANLRSPTRQLRVAPALTPAGRGLVYSDFRSTERSMVAACGPRAQRAAPLPHGRSLRDTRSNVGRGCAAPSPPRVATTARAGARRGTAGGLQPPPARPARTWAPYPRRHRAARPDRRYGAPRGAARSTSC